MKNHGLRNKEILENLYWKRNLSFNQIAKKFGISQRTVRYWATKNGIKSRPKLGKSKRKYNISRKKLIDLYINKKLTLDKIAQKLKIKNHSTVAEYMLKYGIKTRSMSEIKTKHERKQFSGNLIEKSYILGLRTGDLASYKDFHRIIVNTSTTHPALVKNFREVFEKYSYITFYIQRDKRKIKEMHVQAALDSSFDFLLKKIDEIPEWILENDDYFFAFLAGYADAEGSFDIYENTDNTISFHFAVASNDKIILKQICNKLNDKGFSSQFYLKYKKGRKATYGFFTKDFYAVRLFRKKEVLKLVKILQKFSKHNEKLKRIEMMVNLQNETKWDAVESKVLNLRKKIMNSRIMQDI